MATAHQIRDLITETTTGTVRPRVPRDVREEVCRYAARRRDEGAPWAVIARETGVDVRKLQRWQSRARRASAVPVLRPVEVLPAPDPAPALTVVAPSGVRVEGLGLERAVQLLRLLA
jgi:transposase